MNMDLAAEAILEVIRREYDGQLRQLRRRCERLEAQVAALEAKVPSAPAAPRTAG